MLDLKLQQNYLTASKNRRSVQLCAQLLTSSGAVLLAWTIVQIVRGYSDGSLSGSIAYPLSISIGLILSGTLMLLSNFRLAALFFLAGLGQASSLQLIDAGKNMHYQHYMLNWSFLQNHPIPVLVIALQTIVVGVAVWSRRTQILNWLRSNLKTWQIGLGLIMFGIFSATVSPDFRKFIAELLVAAFIQTVNLLNILLIATAIPEKLLARLIAKWNAFLRYRDTSALPAINRFTLIIALWVFLLSAILSLISYQRHPHIPDEVAYIYHARYLADGKLVMPAPPVQEAFEVYLMQIDGDRWYPSPPIGWPMVLAVGEKLGVPWLVNPLLAGFNIFLIYLFLTHLYSDRLARVSIFLLGISPWYIFMGMNFMTHMFTLTCALVSALGLVWVRETGKMRWVFMAGLALGVMSLIRPLEALIWALLLGLWSIGLGGKPLKLSWLVVFVITTGLTASLVLPYNKHLTGSAAVFSINLHTDQRFGPNSNAYGFGPDRGMGWPIDPNLGHNPIDAMINTSLNGFSINIELFGWSTGSLLLVIIFLFSGSYRKSDRLMIAVIIAVYVAFFFYYFSGGPDFGARYWFLMIVPLVALSVRGLDNLRVMIERQYPGSGTRFYAVILVLGVMALVNYFPWRAIDKYYHYLNMRPDIRVLAQEYDFGKSLVLIQGDEHPDYASAFVYNPIDLQADGPIYAWDRSDDIRKQVVSAYRERPVWFVNGPTITQSGYEVIAGPIPGEQVLEDNFDASK